MFTVLYYMTVCPTVPPYRDSGELITAASTLSVAHSPGYPLYMITGKIFIAGGSILGLNPALSMNLFSSVATSASVTLLFYIIYLLTGSLAAAMLGGFLAGLSYVVWLLAVVAEMYALNLFMVVLVVYLVLQKKYLLSSFLIGLTMGNHLTALFAIVPLLLYVVTGSKFKKINFWKPVLFFFLGLSVYLYLPVRALSGPFINWGDPSTVSGVISVITREGYGHTLDLVSREVTLGQVLGPQMMIFFQSLVRDLTPPALLLAVLALYLSFKKKKNQKTVIVFVLMFIFTGPLFIYMARMPVNPHSLAIVEVGYILPQMALLVLSGLGLKLLLKKPDRPVIFLTVGAVVVFRLIATYPEVDKSSNYLARNYAVDILETVADNSAVVLRKDHTLFALWYMNFVEEYRPSVKVISKGLLSAGWYRDKLKKEYPDLNWPGTYYSDDIYIDRLFKENQPDLRVYFTPAAAGELEEPFYRNRKLKSYGLVLKIWPEYEPYESTAIIQKLNPVLEARKDYNAEDYYDFFSRDIIKNYAMFYNRMGRKLLEEGKTGPARDFYSRSIETYPVYPEPYFNLGYTYFMENKLKEADQRYRQGIDKLELKISNYTRKEVFYGQLAEAYNNLGAIYEKKLRETKKEKYFALALDSYTSALKYRPDYSRVYFNKGVIFWGRDWEKAAQNFKKVLEYEPENTRAKNFYHRASANLPN